MANLNLLVTRDERPQKHAENRNEKGGKRSRNLLLVDAIDVQIETRTQNTHRQTLI
jgi:hypothetical protein